MSTLGWLFILLAAWLIRSVLKGQVLDENGNFDLLNNMEKTVVALINGDNKALKELDSAAPGEGIAVPETIAITGQVGLNSGEQNSKEATGEGTQLLANMRQLGDRARGYIMGATGPNYYDCSGLTWRALQKTYPNTWGHVGRFVTATFKISKGFKYVTRVTSPQVGDLALWPNHHIGVVSGPDKFYSARNPRSGIGESNISTFLGGSHVEYYRP